MTALASRKPEADGVRLRKSGQSLTPYLFISPFFLIFLLFGLAPIIFSLVISLFDWQGINTGGFIGIQNYLQLFKDPSFYKAIGNTLIIWVGHIPPMVFLALVFAVLLNNPLFKLRSVFRTVNFMPVITSLVITGLVFTMIFNQSFGLVNTILEGLKLTPLKWLTNPVLMKVVLIIALVWRYTGHDMVIMLAGLQSIPQDIYEAAKVDGANDIQNFFYITIPLIRPVIVFDIILSTIGAFNLFAEPYTLFGADGGTLQGGLTTGTYLYNTSFQFFKLGYGASFAWIIALIIFMLSLLQLRVSKPE